MSKNKTDQKDLTNIKLAKTYTSSVANEKKLKNYIDKNGLKR